MIKVASSSSISNKPKFIFLLIGFLLLIVLLIFGKDYMLESSDNGASHKTSESDRRNKSSINKKAHERNYAEWKQVADARAKEFYECTKDLDMDLSKFYLYESCAKRYNNHWVLFRDGLDYKANLTFEQTKELKDYWHKTRDEATDKVSELMDENDRIKRPNKYK